MDVKKLIHNTLAGQISKVLDNMDGKEDGQISASVWNNFVADKGGKKIKNSISVFNATKSVTTYSVREAQKTKGSTNDTAQKWLDGLKDPEKAAKLQNFPQDDPPENVPQKSDIIPSLVNKLMTTIPQKVTPPAILSAPQNPENAGKKIHNADGTVTEYNSDGYAISSDAKRHHIFIFRDENNTVSGYREGVTNEKDYYEFCAWRNAEGSLTHFERDFHDANGVFTRRIAYDSKDKSDSEVIDYEYNADGQTKRVIYRNYDGKVKSYHDYEYDADGHEKRIIFRNHDGKVKSYEDV